MKPSKDYFEATTVFDDDTIRRLFKIEYRTYERAQMLTRLVIAVALILLAVLVDLPVWAKVLCLLAGSWLFMSGDFPSEVRAEGVIQSRNGAQSKVKYAFTENEIRSNAGPVYAYQDMKRLIEDDDYFYLFKDRQTAVMAAKNTLIPKNPDRFKEFIKKQTGAEWKESKAGWLSLTWRDLLQMVRDKATLWLGK